MGWGLQEVGEMNKGTDNTTTETLTTEIVTITAIDTRLQADIGMVFHLHHPRKSVGQLGQDLEMIIDRIPDSLPDLHRQQSTDMMGQGTEGEMADEIVAEMASVETATDQHLVTSTDRQEAEVEVPTSTLTFPVTGLIAVDLQGREMIGHARIEDHEKTGRQGGMTAKTVDTTETVTAADSITTIEAAADVHAAGVEVRSETVNESEEPESVNR